LINAGFTTGSIFSSSAIEASKLLEIELYVPQIILKEAKRITVTSIDAATAISETIIMMLNVYCLSISV
jgi:hypothetical protein